MRTIQLYIDTDPHARTHARTHTHTHTHTHSDTRGTAESIS